MTGLATHPAMCAHGDIVLFTSAAFHAHPSCRQVSMCTVVLVAAVQASVDAKNLDCLSASFDGLRYCLTSSFHSFPLPSRSSCT